MKKKINEAYLRNAVRDSLHKVLNEDSRPKSTPKKWNVDGVDYESTNQIKSGGAWSRGFRFKDNEKHNPEKLKQFRKRKDGYRYAQDFSDTPHELHNHLVKESQLNRIVRKSLNKVLRESYEESFEPINDNSDNYYNNRYRISLWPGSGYGLVPFDVFANHEQEALDIVTAYIEQNERYHQLFADDAEQAYIDAEFNGDREAAAEDAEYNESFYYVDATMEGANEPHYLWAENLKIRQL